MTLSHNFCYVTVTSLWSIKIVVWTFSCLPDSVVYSLCVIIRCLSVSIFLSGSVIYNEGYGSASGNRSSVRDSVHAAAPVSLFDDEALLNHLINQRRVISSGFGQSQMETYAPCNSAIQESHPVKPAWNFQDEDKGIFPPADDQQKNGDQEGYPIIINHNQRTSKWGMFVSVNIDQNESCSVTTMSSDLNEERVGSLPEFSPCPVLWCDKYVATAEESSVDSHDIDEMAPFCEESISAMCVITEAEFEECTSVTTCVIQSDSCGVQIPSHSIHSDCVVPSSNTSGESGKSIEITAAVKNHEELCAYELTLDAHNIHPSNDVYVSSEISNVMEDILNQISASEPLLNPNQPSSGEFSCRAPNVGDTTLKLAYSNGSVVATSSGNVSQQLSALVAHHMNTPSESNLQSSSPVCVTHDQMNFDLECDLLSQVLNDWSTPGKSASDQSVLSAGCSPVAMEQNRAFFTSTPRPASCHGNGSYALVLSNTASSPEFFVSSCPEDHVQQITDEKSLSGGAHHPCKDGSQMESWNLWCGRDTSLEHESTLTDSDKTKKDDLSLIKPGLVKVLRNFEVVHRKENRDLDEYLREMQQMSITLRGF